MSVLLMFRSAIGPWLQIILAQISGVMQFNETYP
jgi:hypothetical protein